MLFLIDEQNKKGGLASARSSRRSCVDPASDWPLFAEKARELIAVDRRCAVGGCWTSASRKSGAAGLQGAELDLILYPVQYEGEEGPKERHLHRRRAEPAGNPGRRLPDEREKAAREALGARATDYVYPRTTNKILEQYLKDKGVAPEDIKINYTPFGFSDWQTECRRHQGIRLGRQEDRRGLDHQRRRQRALLQGTRQPGHFGRRHPGRRLLGG